MKAGAALADRTARATFVGAQARVASYSPPGPAKPRDWAGFIPERSKFQLKDIGFQTTTVHRVFPPKIRVELKTQPDVKPWESGQKMNIHYAFGPGLQTKISTLEVQLNGVALKSARLDNPEGEDDKWLSLEVPWGLYGPMNYLDLIFHIYPKDFKECERVSDRPLWGTVFDDTTISMPKDYWTEAHNVAGFARWAFPYSLRADLSDAAIIVPEDNPEAIRALVRMAAYLGSANKYPVSRLDVAYEESVPESVLKSRNLIFLAPKPKGAAERALSKAASTLPGEGRVSLGEEDRARLQALVREGGLTLEQVPSPWAEQRVALLVQPILPGEFTSYVEQMLTPANLSQLTTSGVPKRLSSVAVVSKVGAVNTLEIGDTTALLGRIPLARRLGSLFAAHRWLWTIFLVLSLLLPISVIRRVRRIRKQKAR